MYDNRVQRGTRVLRLLLLLVAQRLETITSSVIRKRATRPHSSNTYLHDPSRGETLSIAYPAPVCGAH